MKITRMGKSPVSEIKGRRTIQYEAALRAWLFRVVTRVREHLQAGGGLDYSKLEVVALSEGLGLILPSLPIRLEPAVGWVLYVRPKRESSMLQKLAEFSPWPAGHILEVPEDDGAGLIARKVSPEEYAAVMTRRQADGFTMLSEPRKSVGPVHEDLAWRALRIEFGHDPDVDQRVWTPALNAAKDPKEDLEWLGEWLIGGRRLERNRVREVTDLDPAMLEFFQRTLERGLGDPS